MDVYLRASNWQLPNKFEERVISVVQNQKGVFGLIDLDKTHSHFPARGDTKIMRQDVISSILVIGDLLEKLDLTQEILDEMALYVSNGSFLEEDNKHMNRLIRAFEKFSQLTDKKAKRELLYKNIPPLTALETLTNSTMSFIAQYSKIRGLNTTFGNTSYSSFEALKEGASRLKYKKAKHAMVGGANGGGIYSALNFIPMQADCEGWRESLCCGYALLQKDPVGCSLRIDSCHNDGDVPSLTGPQKSNNWRQFLDESKREELIVYSGGFTTAQFESNQEELKGFANNLYSLNDKYGNTGAAAMFLNLIQAESMMKEQNYKSAVLLDRDPYGRETCVKISKL